MGEAQRAPVWFFVNNSHSEHAHWRGAKNALPSSFSRIAEKRWRAAPPFFQYLLTIELDTLCKNFSPGHQRSGHQVRSKSKTGFWIWGCAVATLDIRLVSNLQRFIRSQIPTTCVSRIFYICHQRSGQFRDLTIISQWAKIQIVPIEWLCVITT